GGPYRRREVVFKAIDFQKQLNEALKENLQTFEYEDPLDEEYGYKDKIHPSIMSVLVDKVVRDDTKPKMKFEPNHPDANKDGYVAYPNINPVVEMADMIEASRAYQANVSSFQTAKGMANSAIELLKV
ncbi:MAG: flagellar basal body rod protein FlgC, partial [Campylobacterales bacterium]|nr:flagellar basal body rod protein FlgC [Campylobacterales bacterium]